MHLSDAEILERFNERENRQYAFNLLIRKYSEKLYWVIRRLVLEHEDANDILQDSWIKIWGHLEDFKSQSNLFTWLYRIAANEALTFLKKRKKRFFVNYNDVESELAETLSSSEIISGNEIELKLQRAILTLPEKQRLVFQMRYYDEMPYEEMSRVVETSVGALKASYHHALKKIEDFLKRSD